MRFNHRRLASYGALALVAVLGTSITATPAGATVAQDPSSTTIDPAATTTTAAPAPPTTAPAPPAPPAPAPLVLHYLPLTGPEFREGNRDSEIWLMQVSLVARGFWLQDGPSVFGASTRHALTAFQKTYGLARSGRLDAQTRFVLGATLDRAVPQINRAGRSAEVDIARQILIVADSGTTTWVFDISSGKASTKTPKGSFKIQRQINGQRVSKLGQLWRPKYFTGGYALHGSPSVPNYPASHGCVRLTNQEINFIWDSNLIPVGTPISLY